MWRVLTLVAVLWPSHLSGVLDGAPLDTGTDGLLLGLVVPTLIWAHPQFLRKTIVRATIAAIFLIKIGAAFAVQQQGWCVTFVPPYPMVRDSTGKPHSWDMRADWLADDPACSAIMTRSYLDTGQLPVWFYNLPPPDDAVVRGPRFSPGEIPVRIGGVGYITVGKEGAFDLSTIPMMDVALRIDGTRVEPAEPAHHHVTLARGSHLVQFEGTLLGKQWRVVPEWNGTAMGSMLFPLTTLRPPSRVERLLIKPLNWLITITLFALIAAWLWSALARVHAPHMLIWSAAASLAIVVVTTYLPQQAPWYTVIVTSLALLMPLRRRFMSVSGIFFVLFVPWLAYVATANAPQIGHWTLYGIGNDNFLFQRFSYRIFMQHYWLEGGQTTFWNQPFFRWIAGAIHMLFGDSSVGQAYWDAGGVAIIMLFAYRSVLPMAGFTFGMIAALVPMAMFLLGPALEFVGFGLSEISSAAFIYLAALFAMRNRGWRDALIAGVLVTLGFYTRLNNLPMAMAVVTFALPVSYAAGDWWRLPKWLPLVQWRVVLAIAAVLAVGGILFAWRTWYYTGVFSLFHGTQREFLAVWKQGMTFREAVPAMISSVLMVLTGQDPPRLALHATPLVAAGVISVAALCGLRGFRSAPLPAVAMFVAGLSGALITRGWGHEGRFSIHLYGSAAALCAWWMATAAHALLRSRNIQPMTIPQRTALTLIAIVALFTAVLPAQQAAMSPADMQRRRDLEAKLQDIAVVERRVMIPMKDGVRLATDIYRPKKASSNSRGTSVEDKWPIIFVKTPYNMNFWDVRNGVPADMSRIIEAIEKGYAYVGQNERGHFFSEGNYDILGAPITDGYETVDYLTKQPWSNGKLGTTGCSSTAEWQPAVASLGHPGFAAMNVQGFGAGIGKVGPYWEQGNWYRGGAMQMLFITWIYGEQNQIRPMFPRNTPREDLIAASRLFDLAPRMPPVDWDKALWHLPTQDILKSVEGPRGIFADRMPVETGGMMQQREPASDAWRKGGLWHEDMKLNLPGLWFMSWYDVSVGPNLEAYNTARRTASAAVRDQQWAIIAPVAHCSYTRASEHTIVGERDMGDARLDYNDIMYAFFDKFLKGDANGRIEKMSKVTYYTMGSNKWQTSDVWPPANVQPMTFHLASAGHANSLTGDGQLAVTAPDADAPDAFTYDPMNPVMSYGGNVCCTGNAVQAGSFDQRKMESRNDILVYTSEPFKDGIEVSGPIVPTLYVSSDAKDTDFTVKVIDVYPDGRAYNLDESIQRMRYRDGYEKKVWMEKDKIYKVTLQPLTTSNYFAPGHRLRIEVSSSNFPRFDRNLNTGGNNYDESKGVIAHNAVHHSKQYPSSVTLSVVRSSTATARNQ